MYAIFGEGKSDVDTLKVLIRRLADDDRSLHTRGHHYGSCGELLKGVRRDLESSAGLGFTRSIVTYDADGPNPAPRLADLQRRVGSFVGPNCCLLIPVQELEAWILADIEAVTKEFSGWTPAPIPNPESITSPKERLRILSRDTRARPRYNHVSHNSKVAEHLDWRKIEAKCLSFRPLVRFVRG